MPTHAYPHSPTHWTRRLQARRAAARRFGDWSGNDVSGASSDLVDDGARDASADDDQTA